MTTSLNSGDNLNSTLEAIGTAVPEMPRRRIRPISEIVAANQLLKIVGKSTIKKPAVPVVDPSGSGGVPKQLLSIAAVQSPTIVQNKTVEEITISFTRDTSDSYFASVDVWFVGYKGSSNPVLMASGTSSPFNFLCESTGETVTVKVQPVGTTGLSAGLNFAKSTTLTLSGVVSNPPAPTIAQSLIPTPTGFQFAFNQVQLSAGTQDVISCYRVYQNTSNTTVGATVIHTYPHDPTNLGSPIVVETAKGDGVTYYFWVSSVNTKGLESTLQAAQVSSVIPSPPPTGAGAMVVSAPVIVTNLLPSGTATLANFVQGNNVPIPGTFEFDVNANGGLIDVLLWASTVGGYPTGYFFRFEGRSGQSHLIAKVDSTPMWTAIGSQFVTNPSALSGWHHIACIVSPARTQSGLQFDMFVDGVWAATAIDATYTPTGKTYYGYEITAGQNMSPSGKIKNSSLVIPEVYNSGVTTSAGAILSSVAGSKTISVAAFTVQYGFGQVSYNSGSVTPAAFGGYTVYYNDPTYAGGAVAYLATSTGYTAVSNDGYNVIGNITTSAGSGGSGGGGGGGPNLCFSPDTKVRTWRGDIAFGDLRPDEDFVLTAKGTWRPIHAIVTTDYKGPMLDMRDGLVTPGHSILHNGKWTPASELGTFTKVVDYEGKVKNLVVLTDDEGDILSPETEHSYTLANGLLAHNLLPS